VIDGLAHLVWREPLWLWLALYPWIFWALRGFINRPRGSNYADPQLMPWARARTTSRFEPRRLWRHAVLALAWLLFAMAMSGPRIAETDYDQSKENYTELMVVLDVSRSMTARDVVPSRLERAKLELQDLIARAGRLKIGLVVYAARAHLMTPPTDDKTVLRHALQVLRFGLLPTEGSNLQGAIEFAAKSFTSEQSAHAILLVTDGEIPVDGATAEERLDDTVSQLAQQGIAFYALGIGTLEGAPLLAQQGGWLSYRGKAVISKLHEDRLQKLTILGNGRYAAVSGTDAEWQALYDQNIRYLHTVDNIRKGDSLIEWHELYGWCLIPAALLMLLAYVEPRRGSLATSHFLWLAVFVIFGWVNPPLAHASDESWQQRAYQAYSNKSYLEAKQGYARVAGYAGRMGEGSSAYRLGRYQESIQLFTQAILDADTDAQRARAVFNMANSHYQLEDYGAAVALYRETLRYDPSDHAAQLNLNFAIAMQKQQQRNGDSGGTARQGRGPRTSRPPEGTDVTSGKLSIDDQDDARPPAIPGIPDTQPLSESDLIAQGIFHSRLAVQQATEFKDPTWHYAATSVERIVLQANSLKVDESILWKRIFEGEESFPAPVETPHELPDMPPW
jgi:Ca-activated chloride channel homolog